MEQQYNLVVIGAGPGGYVAAIKAAQLGMKVAVIENREVGGTCLNRGCIPTKTLMHSAHLYHEVKNFEAVGLKVEGLSYDIKKIHERKEEVVDKLRTGISQLFKANKIDFISGTATISDKNTIVVEKDGEKTEVKTEKILIATGSKPAKPPIEGLTLPNVVTSDEMLSMSDKVYNKLLIIGGGVIGVEFATVYNSLGCEVVIVEAMDRILPTMDKEISQSMAMSLKKKGIKIHTSAMVEKISEENGLTCYYTEKGKAQTETADGILVSIGRRANTENLFADGFEIEMERGCVVVDEKFQTSVEGIYAIGDVIKGIQLAHVASAEGIVAVENMVGKEPSIDLDVVPSCIYTNPEISAVGITADEAKAKGIKVKTGKFIMSANGKSLIAMDERGFIKVVFDEETDVILGAQLMCARATDLISEFTTAIVNKLTSEQLSSVIRPHPTYVEAVTEAIESANGCSIHTAPRK